MQFPIINVVYILNIWKRVVPYRLIQNNILTLITKLLPIRSNVNTCIFLLYFVNLVSIIFRSNYYSLKSVFLYFFANILNKRIVRRNNRDLFNIGIQPQSYLIQPNLRSIKIVFFFFQILRYVLIFFCYKIPILIRIFCYINILTVANRFIVLIFIYLGIFELGCFWFKYFQNTSIFVEINQNVNYCSLYRIFNKFLICV